jgi:hypothetical protein
VTLADQLINRSWSQQFGQRGGLLEALGDGVIEQ